MATPFTIRGLNHFAWRCRDAEETRRFYEELLGLPLTHVIQSDHVPSTGEYCPYVHLFFGMADGSSIAFFDLGDGKPTVQDPATPNWVNHFAMELADETELMAAKARLEAAGVAVVGPTDHHFIKSIYFFDPNGLRLELTCRTKTQAYLDQAAAKAHADLARWTASRKVAAE